jgi:WD40 repeat protein/DNA-binding SARP family transcriptional activator
MPLLRIHLLGSFHVTRDDAPLSAFKSDKVRALLALLVAEPDRPQRRETLGGLLWPGYPEKSARMNLRHVLSSLRRVLDDQAADPPFLLASGHTIQFNRAADAWADVWDLLDLEFDSLGAADTGRLQATVEAYRGPFLEGFSLADSPEFEEWALVTRQRLHRLALEALHELAGRYQAAGEHERALTYAYRQLELDPWRERAHRQVMELLALTGQRAAALAQYETCRRVLREELGAEPSPQTEALYQQLRAGELPAEPAEGAKGAGRSPRPLGPCPYRGLAAFREQDAPFFFGRRSLAGRLAQMIDQGHPAVAVVGSSGMGKSSLVAAGLLPRLRQQLGWLVAAFRPGRRPFHALAGALLPLLEPELSETDRLIETTKLAEALRQGEVTLQSVVERVLDKGADRRRLLLLVDQFEELYTLGSDPDHRPRFLDVLLSTAGPSTGRRGPACVTLLALRADFVGRALDHPALAQVLQDAALMVRPMTSDEMLAAVEKPAAKQGAAFEPGLVDRILDDVGDEPGHLPLLEFALTLLWERNRSGWLTHAGYEEVGQVEGALARHAEGLYQELDPADQESARQVLMQLISPGDGRAVTRRLATRAEIGAANWPIAQHLADGRLVVTGRDRAGEETAELAHEALIGSWHRFQGWIESDRAFRTWQERLRTMVRQWEDSDRGEGALLRGTLLAQARQWLDERRDEMGPAEREFVEASIALQERQQAERRAQQQKELQTAWQLAQSERRRRNVLLVLVGVLVVGAAVALTLAVYANAQRHEALQAYSVSLAAHAQQAMDELDTGTALALALEANRLPDPPIQARRVLLNAAYAPGARRRYAVANLFEGVRGPATAVDVSPDGGTALLGFADGTLILWDLAAEEELGRLGGHADRINDVAFGPEGALALSGGSDGRVILWDLATRRARHRLDGHSGIVRTVDIGPGGRRGVSGGFAGDSYTAPGELFLWDLETGELIRRFEGHVAGIVDAALSADGQTLVSSSGDAELITDSGAAAEEVGGEVRFFDLIAWDVPTGAIRHTFGAAEQDVFSLSLGPADERVLTGSYYHQVAGVWNIATGERQMVLDDHPDPVRAVAWTPDGRRAVAGFRDGSLMVWDLEPGPAAAVHLRAHQAAVLDVAVTPDGRQALSVARDGTLIVWDLTDAAEVQRLQGHRLMVYDVAFTPDGRRALSASGAANPGGPIAGATVKLWDLETGQALRSFDASIGALFQIAVSPDQPLALVSSPAPVITILDLDTWAQTGALAGHEAWVPCVEFTSDGRRALSGSVDGTLIVWDLASRQALHRLVVRGQGLWSLAVSPDGRTALSDSGESAGEASMILWDLEAGRELRTFSRPDQPEGAGVSGIAYLPDGRSAISCEGDGALIEWDLETGREIRRLGTHSSLRTRIVIAPDGELALTSGMDGTLVLWDLTAGEAIRRWGRHGAIFDIALAPDGRTALVGSSDTAIVQWRLDNPSLEDQKRWIDANRAVRDLTCEEREHYQVPPLCAP